jgi:hypothetical protein
MEAVARYTAIILVLAAVSAWNAYRCKVDVTRGPVQEEGKRPVYFWDLAKAYPNVSNWSDYLLSLKYDKPLTLRGFLVGIILSRLSKKPVLKWLALALVGAIPFAGRVVIAQKPIDLLDFIQRFLGMFSIGIISSLADLIHHIKPFQLEHGDDALTKFVQTKLCKSTLPYYDVQHNLDEASRGLLDVIEQPSPEPFLSALFPGLCVGHGGLMQLQSERKAMRNEIMAEIFNRLSANLLVYSDVVDSSKLFLVKYGEDTIRAVDELVAKVPGIRVMFTKNCSTFGVAFCTKLEGTSDYSPLPFFWPSRTSIRDPETGRQLTAAAYHSSFVVVGGKDCPLGEFRAQFFLGPEGVTGWKPGHEFIRPWAPIIASEPLSPEHVTDALRVVACIGCAVNYAARVQDLAVGGYALHGTCVDTMAILKQVLYGRIDDFPLVASGDSRAGTIAACKFFIERLNRGESANWAKDAFQRVSDAVAVLPDDTSVPPQDLLGAIDRFSKSLVGDFVHAKQTIKDLAEIKAKWRRILPAKDIAL